MNDLIKKLEKIIEDLRKHIEYPYKNINDKVVVKSTSIGTQTKILIKKNISTLIYMYTYKDSEKLIQNTQTKSTIDKNQEFVDETKSLTIQGGNKNININTEDAKNKYQLDKNLNKKRVLLLVDDDITWHFRSLINLCSYDVFSVKKAGALLSQVLENMDTLTKDFTRLCNRYGRYK